MSNRRVTAFDDKTILELLGAQAAEDETDSRLKAYFVKNKAYDRVKSDIALRLVVGHKGIGKSALLKIAYLEDKEQDILALWLQPNDITRSWSLDGSFVERVEGIKKTLLSIIAEESFNSVKLFGKAIEDRPVLASARHLIHHITQAFGDVKDGAVDTKVVNCFLKGKRIKVYIDDVDRGWKATKRDVENISALINATRDLANEDKNLQFRIGIRTDAYNLVRENDESGDKFEQYVVPIAWSNHDILVLMAKRVAQYFGDSISEPELARKSQIEISKYLYSIIVSQFDGSGHWANRPIHNVLLSLTRQRPRDLVKLLSAAATVADRYGKQLIETSHLTESFPEYSKGRIADLISEFRSELPEIQRVLYGMKPTKKESHEKPKPFLYTNDELIAKLNSIALNQNIFFANGKKASGQLLAEFLFKIDFVIARKDKPNDIERFYYSDHSKLQSNYADFGFAWEVHPAYRWALNPVSIEDLLKGIDF